MFETKQLSESQGCEHLIIDKRNQKRIQKFFVRQQFSEYNKFYSVLQVITCKALEAIFLSRKTFYPNESFVFCFDTVFFFRNTNLYISKQNQTFRLWFNLQKMLLMQNFGSKKKKRFEFAIYFERSLFWMKLKITTTFLHSINHCKVWQRY